jgi:hypothetical protein
MQPPRLPRNEIQSDFWVLYATPSVECIMQRPGSRLKTRHSWPDGTGMGPSRRQSASICRSRNLQRGNSYRHRRVSFLPYERPTRVFLNACA